MPWEPSHTVVEGIALVGGALLFAFATRHVVVARRHQSRLGVWIGTGLSLSAVAAVLHAGASVADPHNDQLLLRKSILLLSIAGMSGLHAAVVERAQADAPTLFVRGWLVATAVTGIALPSMHYNDPTQPGWWQGFTALLAASYLAAAVHAGTEVWRQAQGQPISAQNRGRLLALGLASLAVAFALGAVGASMAASWFTTVDGVLAGVFLVPGLIALAPPAWLRRRLRRVAMQEVEDALDQLASGATDQDIDAVLPCLADVLGATCVELRDLGGARTHAFGSPAPDRTDRDVSMRFGTLHLQLHPLAPLAGREEELSLVQLARDLDLAILAASRQVELDDEHATRSQLEAARTRLDTINTALAEYSSTIAHDLKTPMTVIRGAVETVLRHEQLSVGGQDLLQRCLRHIDRATELVHGQLASAHHAGETAMVSLEHVLRWVAATCEDELAQANASLIWTPPLPQVHGAEPVLRRVVLNLVRNALQHASRGEPLVIAIVPTPDARAVLVIDDGCGIASHHWSSVFQPGQSLDDRSAGHGLGLPGVRSAMQRIGGDVVILESAIGQGTTFAIQLPPAAVTSADVPGPRPSFDEEETADAPDDHRRQAGPFHSRVSTRN